VCSDSIQLVISLGTAVTAMATLVIAILMIIQSYMIRLSIRAQTYCSINDVLQKEEVRKARKVLIENKIPYDQWKNTDLKDKAELACSTFDIVGVMATNGFFPPKIIVDKWGPSIKKCWSQARELIEDRRINENHPKLWDDFIKLTKRALVEFPEPQQGDSQ
jgi:hypothetical protein